MGTHDVACATCPQPDNATLPFSGSGPRETDAFRTPSLRKPAFNTPHFHGEVVETLDHILEFYATRNSGTTNPLARFDRLDSFVLQLSVGGGRLQLLQSVVALENGQSDPSVPERIPSRLPPSGNLR